MPLYRWTGIDHNGIMHKGSLQADSVGHLQDNLLAEGKALLTHAKTNTFLLQLTQRPITHEQVYQCIQQLATLLGSGIELLRSLEITASLTHNKPMKAVVTDLAAKIQQGNHLYSAMNNYPTIFSSTVRHLVAAGEKTGNLGVVLAHIKELLHIRLIVHQQLRRAAVMPLVTCLISLALAGSIFVFVLPYFEQLYQSLNCPLPRATAYALGISRLLNSWKGAAGLIGMISLILALKYASALPRVKRFIDGWSIRMPVIGSIIVYKELIIFTSVLEMFLLAGLPLAQALEHVINATTNTTVKGILQNAMDGILHGQPLSRALQDQQSPLIDEQLIALIHVGEQSGTLATMLHKANQLYRDKLNAQLHVITTLITPLLTVVLGLLVGGLMITMYLPIFNVGALFKP